MTGSLFAGPFVAAASPFARKRGMSPFHSTSELDTKATCVPSGDQDGTLIVP
jgi:hypothetical protein